MPSELLRRNQSVVEGGGQKSAREPRVTQVEEVVDRGDAAAHQQIQARRRPAQTVETVARQAA